MNYQLVTVGPMQTNSYIVFDEKTRKAAVIDPGFEGEAIALILKRANLSLEKILLTHGHFDHIGAIAALQDAFPGVEICIHGEDAPMLEDPGKNLSFIGGVSVTAPTADHLLKDGEEIEIGDITLRTIHTPGHSGGSVSYWSDGLLFGGDTLFYESIGRYDFGSFEEIQNSLQKLLTLPDDTKVLPGHGPETTIGHERKFNPYLR